TRLVSDWSSDVCSSDLPFDPPRFLVKNWLYRHVRNPMYIGLGVLLLGEALLFPAHRRTILTIMALLFAALHLFIKFYEEPNLHQIGRASCRERGWVLVG